MIVHFDELKKVTSKSFCDVVHASLFSEYVRASSVTTRLKSNHIFEILVSSVDIIENLVMMCKVGERILCRQRFHPDWLIWGCPETFQGGAEDAIRVHRVPCVQLIPPRDNHPSIEEIDQALCQLLPRSHIPHSTGQRLHQFLQQLECVSHERIWGPELVVETHRVLNKESRAVHVEPDKGPILGLIRWPVWKREYQIAALDQEDIPECKFF